MIDTIDTGRLVALQTLFTISLGNKGGKENAQMKATWIGLETFSSIQSLFAILVSGKADI